MSREGGDGIEYEECSCACGEDQSDRAQETKDVSRGTERHDV